MSLRGAIDAMRGKVPPVRSPGNQGEPLEAPEIKAVPPVPWVPPEKSKSVDDGGKPANNIEAQSGKAPEAPKPAPSEPTRRAVVRFKLIGNQGGGSVLGDFGDTPTYLAEGLRRRYGERLAGIEGEP